MCSTCAILLKSTFMIYTLIALLIAFTPLCALAQKHSIYADVGITNVRLLPGGSVTYNYKLAGFLGAGAGFQVHNFFPTIADEHKYVPALYADLRFTAWAKRKNSFVSFLDFGWDMYKNDSEYYRDSISVGFVPYNNGFYNSLGLGYFHKVTKNGGGAYVTLKLMLNWYNYREYSILAEEYDRSLLATSGSIALSIGYKF